jgi:hypothetical protein
MRKSIFSLTVTCAAVAAVLFMIFGNFTIPYSLGTASLDNIQLPVISNQSDDSAVEKLAQALQQDKQNGDENGGQNWDKAIESLSVEMGIPVDNDIEDALLDITEIHLENISNDN